MSEQIRHIVLLTLRPNIGEEVKLEALQRLRDLGRNTPGILEWTVCESLDTRKGVVIVENGLFVNEKAFTDFKASEEHAACGNFLKEIADWIVGDYRETVHLSKA